MKILSLIFLLIAISSVKSQNYKKIHRKAVVADTHNDIISTCIEKGYRFDENLEGKTQSDLDR
ncbi:MAG: hypothetical protein ACTHM5_03040, partial [Ginsengibacter sp.]